MTSAISLNALTKRYGDVAALTDLTLDVAAGSIFGFLGPNGAGKTTALMILAGLSRATSGSATIGGIPVSVEGSHRGQVGYLAQEPRFYGWMSGRETLEYVASFYAVESTKRELNELLDLVGLADAGDRATKTYSGGMRQRLGIAQALTGGPSVLLLDEPAAALDPLGRHDVLEIMRRLRGDKTIFYSTHILDDVERVSDHVAILDKGRLVVSAPTSELLAATTGSIRVALIGATESTAAALAAIPGVTGVSPGGRQRDEWSFDLTVLDGRTADVQRSVMRFAVDAGLIVASNRQEAPGLEEAFLRIVDKERAA